jgi:outer membrane protein TolC
LAGICLFLSVGSVGAQTTGREEGKGDQTYPIDLPSALKLAGAQNLDIKISRERLKEAEANRTSALEKFFPWLAPGVYYHRRDGLAQAVPSGVISSANFDSYAPGGTVAAQIDVGDAIYTSLASKQLVKAARQGLEVQNRDSVLSAAERYLDLAKANALVEVARQALETSKDYQKQLHTAVGAGVAFRGDELRVQTQTERYQIALRQSKEQERLAAVSLAEVLHLDQSLVLTPVDSTLVPLTLVPTNSDASVLVEQALGARPELKQGKAQTDAARAAKAGAVYGPLIPSIGAQVFAGGLGGGPDHGPHTFGGEQDYVVSAMWRIGPGGLFDMGRIRASEARLTTAELSEAKLKDTVTAQVVSSLTQVQSLLDQI